MDMSKMVQLKGYEGYYFDEDFNIWSFKRRKPKMLKLCPRWKNKGSRQKHLRVNINRKYLTIHRLVYETFKGEIPEGQMVRHLDDNEFNNRPENLALGTHKDNVQDCIRNGNYKGKITQAQAREIILLAVHFKGVEIAEFYEVHPKTIYAILSGRTWKHVDRENLSFEGGSYVQSKSIS